MFRVTTNDFTFPVPLLLPGGRDARGLRWTELHKLLRPVLGDDFDPADGKQSLLVKFAAKIEKEAAGGAEDLLAITRAERRRSESHDPGKPMVAGRVGPIDTRTADDGSTATGASARV
jgi:hypothetical protein